jgi:hypothetical protein
VVDDFLSRTITVPDTVLYEQLDSEVVLFSLTTQHYYGLDELGTRVWQLLLERQTVASILADLLQEYEVEEVVLRRDVERLVGELAANGLIEL